MTKHKLPCNYRIYLKLIEINGIGMPDANIMNLIIYISHEELLPIYYFIIVLYGKLQ